MRLNFLLFTNGKLILVHIVYCSTIPVSSLFFGEHPSVPPQRCRSRASTSGAGGHGYDFLSGHTKDFNNVSNGCPPCTLGCEVSITTD